MDVFASDVQQVIDHFDSAPAIVGASMGGMSALLAQGHAERQLYAAVVLVDVTPRMELGGVTRIMEFMAANPEGFATLDDAATAISDYNPHRARPKSAQGLERVLRQGPDGRWRWRWDPKFMSWGREEGATAELLEARMTEMANTLYAAAGRLTAPTLLVRGAQSDLVSDDSVAEFLAAVPQASYVDISGAGHMVAGDDNDAFTTAVTDFLKDHVPVGPHDAALLQTRAHAARALRSLGHALVAHEGNLDDLTELATAADDLATRLMATPPRDRLADMLARPRPEAAGRDRSDELVLSRHTMVGGTENPFSLDARYRREGDEVVAEAVLGTGFEGAPGRAHAGAMSALIDETMVAAIDALGISAITAELQLRYLAPTPLHAPLEIRARVARRDGDRIEVHCTASCRGRAFVEATGTFTPVDLRRFASELEGRLEAL
jgi:pimeloyl-ACP methyl ester carboxylesterase/acyl-coenzyme A thioesterase PaaI-like protein